MEFNELSGLILKSNPNADIKLIRKAFDFSKRLHEGQLRVSKEPYFSHPFEVAKILVSMNVQSSTLCAGLLHDVVEESSASISDIKKEFGDGIANLVAGVTKIEKVNFESKEDYNSENLRKVLLATAKDIRVMLIKLADRLHNMRTLKHFHEEKQKRIARETLEIYAPIAHKLGIWKIKGELEDLSMRYLMPETYRQIAKKINEKRELREKATEAIKKEIGEKLREKGIKVVVMGRAKYFYSIYKKMVKKNVDVSEIYDLIAIRILTETIPDCYAALGAVHELWKPMPRRFKDFISNPKANGYQSLHTILEGPNDKVLEVQIRTYDMDRVAEYGVAAHWKYHGTERDKKFEKRISWIKQILKWRNDSSEGRNFMETLKLDLFENEIVVFTPKGDPINLKEGSTPVDFAFEVHSNLGMKCSKALVNGKLVPLEQELQPGDIVEIITHKNAEPSRQWLNFVKTSKAKSKIRSFLKITAGSSKPRPGRSLDSGHDGILALLEVKGPKAAVKLSKCCNPKFGDKIKGYYTKDRKITVHRGDCINLHSISQHREARVYWKDDAVKVDSNNRFSIVMTDEDGILVDLLNYFTKNRIKLSKIQAKPKKDKTFHVIIEVDKAEKRLAERIPEIRKMRGVINITKLE